MLNSEKLWNNSIKSTAKWCLCLIKELILCRLKIMIIQNCYLFSHSFYLKKSTKYNIP